MDSADPVHATWTPTVINMYAPPSSSGCQIAFELTLDPTTYTKYGAPQTVWLNYTFEAQSPLVDIEVAWFNKTATRLVEAMWLSFEPIVGDPEFWAMDVMGFPVSPFEVAPFGAQHLHGIWTGVTYANPQTGSDDQIDSFTASIHPICLRSDLPAD